MGEDCGTWLRQLHFDWQSPNLSSFGAPLDAGKQNGISAAMDPGINMATRNETMLAFASPALPHLQLGQSNAPHGWFYCLPRFRQGFTPVPNFTAEERLPSEHAKSFREQIPPNGQSGFPQKQFLVVDQTGDQTTLIYSSRFGSSPDECRLASWDSNLHGTNNLNGNEPSFRRDLDLNRVVVGPTLDDKVNENQGTDTESEMHEDTEEINALLYSDSDGYSTEDDDEVTSTGHSPSTMTTHDNQEPIKETAGEIASSSGKTKKRKLFDESYDDIQIMDTASSLNPNRPIDMGDDDAESRCSSGSNNIQEFDEMSSLLGNKKMRKEKILDVLSILQCMIPGGKDKEPVQLLDEAIRCLKSLKHKAQFLGLDDAALQVGEF